MPVPLSRPCPDSRTKNYRTGVAVKSNQKPYLGKCVPGSRAATFSYRYYNISFKQFHMLTPPWSWSWILQYCYCPLLNGKRRRWIRHGRAGRPDDQPQVDWGHAVAVAQENVCVLCENPRCAVHLKYKCHVQRRPTLTVLRIRWAHALRDAECSLYERNALNRLLTVDSEMNLASSSSSSSSSSWLKFTTPTGDKTWTGASKRGRTL
jgi:hypothetical protein